MDGSLGVDGTFRMRISPVASSRITKSENVPPISTPMRNGPPPLYPLVLMSSLRGNPGQRPQLAHPDRLPEPNYIRRASSGWWPLTRIRRPVSYPGRLDSGTSACESDCLPEPG